MDHQESRQLERSYFAPSSCRGAVLGWVTNLPPERWSELQEREQRRMDEYDKQRYGEEFVERLTAARRLRERVGSSGEVEYGIAKKERNA